VSDFQVVELHQHRWEKTISYSSMHVFRYLLISRILLLLKIRSIVIQVIKMQLILTLNSKYYLNSLSYFQMNI